MKFKLVFLIISVMFILPMDAYAIINNNGVEMTNEEYNIFLQMFSLDYVMNMKEERYKTLTDLDLDNVQTEKVYYIDAYNGNLGLVTSKKVSAEEFQSYDSKNKTLSTSSRTTSTSAKSVTLSIVKNGNYYSVLLYVVWKGAPVVRSYDLIGIRFYGDFYLLNDSIYGEQNYTDTSGDYHKITYAWNGINTQRFSNGYGTTINLINDNITSLSILTECSLLLNGTSGTIYGSYQHAVTNLSLQTSKSYTLDSTGLGNVFLFSKTKNALKYDGMSGVYITY